MIEAELRRTLSSYPDARCIFIAYSGGLDSSVLLHAAKNCIGPDVRLSAIHVHHGLSVNADDWVTHCQSECDRLQLSLIVEHVQLDRAGKSLEEAAREARYAAFKQHLSDGDVLLMGHHADDQVETVLMRMLRGGDSALLAGIPFERVVNGASLIRPLLGFTKTQLKQYAKAQALNWVEDESNECLDITRNRLRGRLIPKVSAGYPGFKRLVLNLTSATAKLNASKQALARQLLPMAIIKIYGQEQGLCLDVLSKLSQSAQEPFVRAWLAENHIPQPSAKNFARIWSELISAKAAASPEILWKGVGLRRYRNGVFVCRVPAMCSAQLLLDEEGSRAELLSVILRKLSVSKQAFDVSSGELTLVSWRCLGKPTSFMGRKKKEWAKQYAIAPWQRECLVFVYCGEVALGLFDCSAKSFVELTLS